MKNKASKKTSTPQNKTASPQPSKSSRVEKSQDSQKKENYPNEIYEESLPPEHRLN